MLITRLPPQLIIETDPEQEEELTKHLNKSVSGAFKKITLS
jgi:hypothetical protein